MTVSALLTLTFNGKFRQFLLAILFTAKENNCSLFRSWALTSTLDICCHVTVSLPFSKVNKPNSLGVSSQFVLLSALCSV